MNFKNKQSLQKFVEDDDKKYSEAWHYMTIFHYFD